MKIHGNHKEIYVKVTMEKLGMTELAIIHCFHLKKNGPNPWENIWYDGVYRKEFAEELLDTICSARLDHFPLLGNENVDRWVMAQIKQKDRERKW